MATEVNAVSAPVRVSPRRMPRIVITPTAIAILAAALLVCGVQNATGQTAPPPVDNRADENAPNDAKSTTELNKELSNPISTIWSITFQENTYWLNMPAGHSDRNQMNVQFQPVLLISLTKDWNLISRPVFQVLNSNPYINRSGNLHRVTGFGDTVFVTLLSPSDDLVGNWLLGVGPTFIFPTASNTRLGRISGRWGPRSWLVISGQSSSSGYSRSSGGRRAVPDQTRPAR